MLTVAQHGGLAVAWSQQDKNAVEHELRRLSPTLFLDPEMDPGHGVYWTVKEHIGSGHPPVTCLVWREPNGKPLPLSFGIVEQVKRQEGRFADRARDAIDHNKRRMEKLRENADETYGDIADAHMKRLKAAESRTLPPFWRPKHFGRK